MSSRPSARSAHGSATQQTFRRASYAAAASRQKVTGTAAAGAQQVICRVVDLPGGLEVGRKLSGGGVGAEWQAVAVDDGQF